MLSTPRLLLVVFQLGVVVAHLSKDLVGEKGHFKDGAHNLAFDQEAFLGAEEARKFRQLSPEESKERLAKLIAKVDTDQSGRLSRQELRDQVRLMQRQFVEKDVDRTWRHHDGDRTGSLSWAEYRDAVYGPLADAEKGAEALGPEYRENMRKDERRFKMADRDANAKLDKAEYICFTHPEDCAHMRDALVAEATEKMDADGDGLVSMKEYIDDLYIPADYPELAPGEEPAWVHSERDMFRQYRDKNGDGVLDAHEMGEWISPTGYDHAEAEASHLLYSADDDKDGELSRDEILAHHEIFAGSQVTDYGEQLKRHDPSEL